jgi:adenylate cyclase
LVQALLTGLCVAAIVVAIQWAGLFTSMQVRSADYLYRTDGDPGDEIIIVAVDEQSLQTLGDWPWPPEYHAQLFERLGGAKAVGFDVLLPLAGPEGHAGTAALLEATRGAGNVVLPLAALELIPPQNEGDLYTAGQTVVPFEALQQAAATMGSVEVIPDVDGMLRRIPLLVNAGTDEPWESFSLRILRLYLDLGDEAASLMGDRVVIGSETEIWFEARSNSNGVMLVNYVGRPNTFPSVSFLDVIQDRVDASVFEDKIVLVGMMNAVNEMDLHNTPVSAGRMAGIEFHANAIHSLLNHRALVRQSREAIAVTVIVLALVLAAVLSQVGAVFGVLFSALFAAGYFVLTGLQFDRGYLPNVLFPYATIFVTFAAVMAVRFASARGERRRVSDIFGRFVSPEVRDVIVDMALQDPDLIRPGGRLMEISILFADIRGFTAMSEKLPPSDVVTVLNEYLDSMEEQVFRYGGTLDKYTGDGMMVLFGAPIPQPDHAERAVRAALGMQKAAVELGQRRRSKQEHIAYGIGIATGLAVAGHIGSTRRLDYTAIGDTVNLAARLEGKAPPEAVLISQATYEAVKDIVIAEVLEPMQVKGKELPVTVYRVRSLREGARPE